MQGKSRKNTEQEELEKIAYSKEMKATLEEFLKAIDPEAFTDKGKVKNYKIEGKELEFNPMGGIIIPLVINDNQKLTVSVHVQQDTETNKYFVAANSRSKELGNLLRGE